MESICRRCRGTSQSSCSSFLPPQTWRLLRRYISCGIFSRRGFSSTLHSLDIGRSPFRDASFTMGTPLLLMQHHLEELLAELCDMQLLDLFGIAQFHAQTHCTICTMCGTSCVGSSSNPLFDGCLCGNACTRFGLLPKADPSREAANLDARSGGL